MAWLAEKKSAPKKKTAALPPGVVSNRTGRLSPRELYDEINHVFLTSIAEGLSVRQSAGRAGKTVGCFNYRKSIDPRFSDQWDEAARIGAHFEKDTDQKFLNLVSEGLGINAAARLVGRSLINFSKKRLIDADFNRSFQAASQTGLQKRLEKLRTRDMAVFLEAIRSGKSVAQASMAVGMPSSSLYFLKKNDAEFAVQWDQAMNEKFKRLKNNGLNNPGPNF
jgi:hypothetical protein